MLGYEQLTEPERAVWGAIESGALVDLPLGASAADDPADDETSDEDRQIRAQLLYELLADASGATVAPARHLRLQGARITGQLDLKAATLRCPWPNDRCPYPNHSEC